jgi:hypothetical protein
MQRVYVLATIDSVSKVCFRKCVQCLRIDFFLNSDFIIKYLVLNSAEYETLLMAYDDFSTVVWNYSIAPCHAKNVTH